MSATSHIRRPSVLGGSEAATQAKPAAVSKTQIIPEEEEWEFRECFAWFDKDGDGYMSAVDLPTAVRAMGQYWSFPELKVLLQEFPPSTKLNFRQFLDVCERKYGILPDVAAVERAFEVFDRTETNRVLLDDVRHVLSTVGEKLTTAEFEELCEINGIPYRGGSQTIDKQQFLTMFGVGPRKTDQSTA